MFTGRHNAATLQITKPKDLKSLDSSTPAPGLHSGPGAGRECPEPKGLKAVGPYCRGFQPPDHYPPKGQTPRLASTPKINGSAGGPRERTKT